MCDLIVGVAINMGCNTVTDYNGEEGDKGLEKNGRFDESLSMHVNNYVIVH